ncbi:MAG: DUF4124 domain-containing protein [Gammaproteobacteria bacterium]|nr:DUF4124 domain-containing protein [Gammaproteobacteria bacterium]MCW8924057.1 DUF4124 domain-containing protein [Gammaproteobacteria bacterium]
MNIKNMCVFENNFNHVWLNSIVAVVSLFYFEPALAGPYKCVDENNNVTYTDQRCLNQTREKLDIKVPPVDKAAAERLKYLKEITPSSSKSIGKIKIIDAEKPNTRCAKYANQIKNLRDRQRSGYTPEEGEGIRNSINHASKAYSDCMNK